MRQLGRLGVWYPIDRLDAGGIRRLLRTIEDLGYSTFWYPEALGYESLSIASFMLANTERLTVGSSIANIYARDPFTGDAACAPCPAFTTIASSSVSE
jgi:alkanesulfonate monooxygenase SsuD/methylene tetrahydromethanopterin reductase-like flavin-dependent oxidoreductase (luciferase family)